MDSEAFHQEFKFSAFKGQACHKWCEWAVSNDQGVMKPGTNLWEYLPCLIVFSKLVKQKSTTLFNEIILQSSCVLRSSNVKALAYNLCRLFCNVQLYADVLAHVL